MATPETLNQSIKSLALAQGFCACGVVRAQYLVQDAGHFDKWIAQGRHGQMDYMARNSDKRLDARLLVEGAQSIVCLAHPYLTPHSEEISRRTGVAKYALGEDYHTVLKDKMHAMCDALAEETGNFSYRAFTDSAPVAERRLAQLAGLGWIGKSSMLILPGIGSYVFLSEIITTLDIAPDDPFPYDRCGACRRCRMACPTRAIDGSGNIDARRCISYATIELKGEIPEEVAGKLDGRVYGCDACLDACPWNKNTRTTDETRFSPRSFLSAMSHTDWLPLDEKTFAQNFAGSPMERTGLDKIKSTAAQTKKNNLAE